MPQKAGCIHLGGGGGMHAARGWLYPLRALCRPHEASRIHWEPCASHTEAVVPVGPCALHTGPIISTGGPVHCTQGWLYPMEVEHADQG